MARANTINKPRGNKRVASRTNAAVGYVRRSTDRQEQSIPDQKRAIERYCEERDMRLIRFYTDDAISGTSTIGRRAFQSLIDDASSSHCDFSNVVVYDVKRFGRIDNDEAGYYRHILKSHDVQVHYTSEHFTGDGTDDLLRPVKQWQAREESKDLSKVAIRGLLSKADSGGGWWMGGAPPYGYDLAYESQTGEFLFYLRYMRDGSKEMFDKKWKLTRVLQRGETVAVSRKDRCKLVPSEQSRVEVIKRIFKMYVEQRRGFKGIADALNRDGVPTARSTDWAKHYSGKWSLTTIRAILVNPAYAGDLVWNRRTDGRFHRITNGRAVERKGTVGRRLELNDEEDWIVIKDAHEPLVTRRLFESAGKRLSELVASQGQRGVNQRTGLPAGERAPTNGWTGARARFMLSGLCSCARCGNRYEGHTRYEAQRDEQGNRAKTYHYACGGYIRHGRSTCKLNAVPLQLLEQRAVAEIIEFYSRFTAKDGRDAIETAIDEQIGRDQESSEKQQKQLHAKMKKLDDSIRSLLDNISVANADLANGRVSELSHERDQIVSQIESLRNAALGRRDVNSLIDDVYEFCGALESMLTSDVLHDRQTAARRCVQSITIDQKKKVAQLTLRNVPTTVLGQHDASTTTVAFLLTGKSNKCYIPDNCASIAASKNTIR